MYAYPAYEAMSRARQAPAEPPPGRAELRRTRAEQPSRDMHELRSRRRAARRRRRVARVDVGLGVLCAVVLLLVTDGVASAGLFGIVLLSACALSLVLERRRSRRP